MRCGDIAWTLPGGRGGLGCSVDWIVLLMDARAPKPGPRGPYKSKARTTDPRSMPGIGRGRPGVYETEDTLQRAKGK